LRKKSSRGHAKHPRKVAPPSFTVAVMSDLHAYSAADPGRAEKKRISPSYLCADPAPVALHGNPLDDLTKLIHEEGMRADAVFCPGDLGDIASASGIQFAWAGVERVARSLKAKAVYATAGNHDLNHTHHEPEEELKRINAFPVAKAAIRAAFWADHYAIVTDRHARIILLNSSAYHAAEDSERKYGRVSERTLLGLAQELRKSPRQAVQLLLCHHHPHQHADYDLGEADVMKYGQHLLDLLAKHGNWLVVHGHKHHPKLTHAAGNSTAPWVFAAGSLAAMPNPSTVGHARNQFYLVHFDPSSFAYRGWGGSIQAWDWAPFDGWKPATAGSGLPATTNFGYLGDIEQLAGEIYKLLPAAYEGYREWSDLLGKVPPLLRVCPRDIEELRTFELRVEFNDRGEPHQVARGNR
jgi:3',5'-cyclic AMP phosphodiesterase CpdA